MSQDSEDTSPKAFAVSSSSKSDNELELAPIQDGIPAVLKFEEEPADVLVPKPNKTSSETVEKPKKRYGYLL